VVLDGIGGEHPGCQASNSAATRASITPGG
jgi:hypothetical protein